MRRINHLALYEPRDTNQLLDAIHGLEHPLHSDADLDPLLDRIGDARFVLLGEASHGTADYYNWRAHISKRLITEKGFTVIAVEGDWPDCYRVNRYVKDFADSGGNARDVLHAFSRWPTWMWANEEIVELVEWLRQHNDGEKERNKVGFYGLDVYSLWDSLHAVIDYLGRKDPAALAAARRAFRCFQPYGDEGAEYARAAAMAPKSCEEEVIALLTQLRHNQPRFEQDGRESFFVAEQNALVVKNAEAYYRTMIHGDAESWNVRDRHMVQTLGRLMRFHGPDAKAIIWEHNTHIGDARATDMAQAGMVNVGQLVRQQHEDAGVVLVGFGSYRGSVIAAEQWGAPMQRLTVPPARQRSWEEILHHGGEHDRLLIFRGDGNDADELLEPRGHRAIGVVYHPEWEYYGNYVPTVMPERYDAFLYFDTTQALHPLHMKAEVGEEVPETYPSGV
jgi:erythromycin esterase-like protein